MIFRKSIAIVLATAMILTSFQFGSFNSYAAEIGDNTEIEMTENIDETVDNEAVVATESEDGVENTQGDDVKTIEQQAAPAEDTAEETVEVQKADAAEADESSENETVVEVEDLELVEEEAQESKLLNMTDFGFYLDANGGKFYDDSFVKLWAVKGPLIGYLPEREGYIFAGWYFNSECTDDMRASTVDNNDLLQCELIDEDEGSSENAMVRLYDKKTLYARWRSVDQTYEVKLIFGMDVESEPTTEAAIGLGFYRPVYDFDNPVEEYIVRVPEGELLSNYFYIGNVDSYENRYPHYSDAKSKYENGTYSSDGYTIFYTKEDMSEEIDIDGLRVTKPMTLYKKYYRDKTVITVHARPENDTTENAYFLKDGEEVDTYKISFTDARIASEAPYPLGISGAVGSAKNKNASRVVASYYFKDNNGNTKTQPANYGIHMTPGKDMDVYLEWTNATAGNGNYVITYHAGNASKGGFFIDKDTGEKRDKITFDVYKDNSDHLYNVFEYGIFCQDLYKDIEGWALTNNATKPDFDVFGVEGNFKENVDVYPVWSSTNKFRLVNFHGNDGVFSADTKRYGGYILSDDKKTLTKQVSYGDEHGWGLSSGDTITDVKVSKTGYTFGGWYMDEECTEPVITRDGYIADKKYTKDYDFYAKWIQGHKVTFNYGEGADSAGNVNTEYTVSTGSTLKREGFGIPENPTFTDDKLFVGWYTDSACTNAIEKDDINNFPITKDVTFYAKYEDAVTVTFDAKEGHFADGENTVQIKLPKGSKIGNKAPIPETNDNKAFDSWYEDESCISSPVSSISNTKATTAVTYYAHYSDCYTITFHSNKSGARLDGVSETIAVKVPKGKAFTYSNYKASGVFNVPTMDKRDYGKIPMFYLDDAGNTLIYSTNKNGTGKQYIFNKNYHAIREVAGSTVNTTYMPETGFVPTGDMDLYAVWNDAVEVTFVSGTTEFTENFHTGIYTPELTDNGTTYKVVVAKGTLLSDINTQYKFGHNTYGFTASHVTGWYADAALKQPANPDMVISANTSIYAKWSKYNDNSPLYLYANAGYFGTGDKVTYAVERTGEAKETVSCPIPTSKDLSKAFAGWYTDAALTQAFEGAVNYKNDKCYLTVPKTVKNLYAKYDDASSVILDANGGYFAGEADLDYKITATEIVAGQGINLAYYESRLSRTDKSVFTGWYTDSDLTTKATTVCTAAGEEYYYPTDGTGTLYAKWRDYVDSDIIIEGADSYTLAVGQSININVRVEKSDADEGVRFVIDKNAGEDGQNSISIDSTGKLTALTPGDAIIHATVDGKVSNKISIKVVKATENVIFKVSKLNLVKGEEYTLDAVEVFPTEKASAVTFTSSNNNIVKVAGNKITAQNQEGTAKITAKVGNAKAELEVNVASPIKLSANEVVLSAKEGVNFELTPIVAGKANLEKVVKWSIDNTSVLTTARKSKLEDTIILTPATNITEKKVVKITATLEGTEYSDSCEVTIYPELNVAAPKADIAPGVVKAGTKVQLNTDTYLADIYYTVLGDTPTKDSILYTDAIVINKTTTIKAIAMKDECKDSTVATFTYTVNTNDWGDVPADLQPLFGNVSTKVPQGMWFIIGDRDKYYTQGGQTTYAETYTGNNITFNEKVEVYQGTTKLVEKRDYTVSYARNKVAANQDNVKKAPTVTITGKGNYTAKAPFTFTINKASLAAAAVTTEHTVAVNMGANVKISNTKPQYSFNGKKLALNKDYVLKYYKNAVEAANEVALPTKEIVNDAAVKYYIVAVAKDGSNFEGQVTSDNYVEVKPIDKTTTLMASRLKAVDAKGKAIKLPYDATKAVDLATLFDNSNGKEAMAYIKDGNKILVYGQDYKLNPLTATDYKSAGKHSFVVEGLQKTLTAEDIANKVKNYAGTKTLSFEIVGTSLNKVKIAGLSATVEYTGKAITMADLFNEKDKKLESTWKTVTLYQYDKEKQANVPLVENKDYTVAMDNNGSIGKFSLVFTGINGYSGTIKKTITVKAFNLKNNKDGKLEIKVLETPATYTKAGVKPQVQVTFDGNTLKEGVDYTLAYKNNTKIVADYTLLKSGKPTVTVKGKGNYTGSNASAFFNIKKADIAGVTITLSDVAYNAKSSGKNGYFMKATPKLMDGAKAISAGKNKDVEAFKRTDYSYTYAYDTVLEDGTKKYAGTVVQATDKVAPGTVIKVNLTVKCSEKSSYTSAENGTVLTGYYRVIDNATNISKFSVKVKDLKKLAYNDSKAVMPLKASDIEISYKKKVGGKNTTIVLDPSDYEIVSISNNKLIGKATVVIRGKNEYGGEKTFSFNIKARSFAN